MNHSYIRASDAVSADAVSTRAFLQQAVDHYPRLAAFSFTLALPYREAMSEYRSLILRFHSEVWQRTGEYSRQRQQARHRSLPTLLRWIWETASAPECKMVLLLNLDTLGTERNLQLTDSAPPGLNAIIADAWQKVTGTACTDGVTSMTQIIINRVAQGVFATPFNQLTVHVKAMSEPIATARTGVICP
ncbi:inovirus Gp2 family protein [Escherichia coli]|nr:inovirus Gp2 family protein [Escherichia coli]EGI4678412.1 inovirus Gp2 family protein [Escherichia coli]EJB5576936.1 inovirus-type Gp2 protein [Citrobacter freundii]MGS26733.1 inovirus Gp2 family protein [Escherichia coli]MHU10020.1 inovirus Gp2 family protein [Escherichia coli]